VARALRGRARGRQESQNQQQGHVRRSGCQDGAGTKQVTKERQRVAGTMATEQDGPPIGPAHLVAQAASPVSGAAELPSQQGGSSQAKTTSVKPTKSNKPKKLEGQRVTSPPQARQAAPLRGRVATPVAMTETAGLSDVLSSQQRAGRGSPMRTGAGCHAACAGAPQPPKLVPALL
jgi:hypothetical protein